MVNFPRTSTDPQDAVKVVAVVKVVEDLADLDLADLDSADLVVLADAKVDLDLVDLVDVKEVLVEDQGSVVLADVKVVQEDVKVVQEDQVAQLLFPQILIACSSMQ